MITVAGLDTTGTTRLPQYVDIYIYSILSHEYTVKIWVYGEGTSLSRVGPYRFCSGGTLDKPS